MSKPKLGQHFLVDIGFVHKIMKAAEITEKDAIIEVGPGKGVLTKALCKQAGLVLALELDERLADGLHDRLGHFENLEIRKQDARYVDWNQICQELRGRGFDSIKMVSNLPYYLASQMVIHAMAAEQGCKRFVIMVQAEVARRMDAKPGIKDYSSYTVAVQYYATTKYICTVPAKAFNPPPQVSSAVICLDKREKPALDLVDVDKFFYMVRAMFNHRRKTLRKCLTGTSSVPDQKTWDEIITQVGIDPVRRPETLTMEEMSELVNAIE